MPSQPRSTARRMLVRLVFVVIVILMPVQLLVRAAMGEPFPALIQPGFAYSATALERADSIRAVEVVVEVTTSAGATVALGQDEIIPWSAGISPTTILTKSLLDPDRPAPATVAWLEERIRLALPGSDAASARVIRYTYLTDATTLDQFDRSITDEMTIDLGAAP